MCQLMQAYDIAITSQNLHYLHGRPVPTRGATAQRFRRIMRDARNRVPHEPGPVSLEHQMTERFVATGAEEQGIHFILEQDHVQVSVPAQRCLGYRREWSEPELRELLQIPAELPIRVTHWMDLVWVQGRDD